MNVATDDTTLIISRFFEAPPDRVFDSWLIREKWQAWIGPEGTQSEVPVLEPRIGGRYRIIMRLSNGSVVPVSGVFKTIDRPKSLAFTWGWENDPSRESLVTLTFAPKGDGTAFTLRQEGLGSVENRDGHDKGWNNALNKLVAFLKTK